MTTINKLNKALCTFADNAVVDGKSYFIWGEKEIPESLKEMYKKEQEEKVDENN